MPPKRSSHVHPLSLTQKQCQMLLLLGAPVCLPGPRFWTWITWHRPSTGPLTFPSPSSPIVQVTPGFTYVTMCAKWFHGTVCPHSASGSNFVWIGKWKMFNHVHMLSWNACASKNLEVFELFSGTGRIHSEARLNLRIWLFVWLRMVPKLCTVYMYNV